MSSGEVVDVCGPYCECLSALLTLLLPTVDREAVAVHPLPGKPGPVLCRGPRERLVDPTSDLAPLDSRAGPPASGQRVLAASQENP